jgi:hypothetical protein
MLKLDVASKHLTPVSTTECVAHSASLGVFDPMFAPLYEQTAAGQLVGVIGAEACEFPLVKTLATAAITAGLNGVRVRASGSHPTVFGTERLPVLVGIQQLDTPVN